MLKRNIFIFTILTMILVLWALPVLAEVIVDTAWTRVFQVTQWWFGSVPSITMDTYGNAYVAGASYTSGTNNDYVTVKYYPNGDTVWVRRYNDSRNEDDIPTSIAVDASENVYVTGYSGGIVTNWQYATIKYYPNGDTAWVREYSTCQSCGDSAAAIVVDGSGNVYVTGGTYTDTMGMNYTTIKYYPNGDTAWVRRYRSGNWPFPNSSSALVVDASGNIYVTGGSQGSDGTIQFATIKYDSTGETIWVERFGNGGNLFNGALDLVIDQNNNVYVTGPMSDTGWGSDDYDYVSIKYLPNGDTVWVRRYNGPGNGDDWASAIAVDGWNNVYVTGYSYDTSSTGGAYVTIKYYPNGDTGWVRRYHGPGDPYWTHTAIAIDSSGDVYVTGETLGSGTDWDHVTIKYDSWGNQLWIKQYNGPGNSTDYAGHIVVDNSGNAYVTGISVSNDIKNVTIKYEQIGIRGDANSDGLIELGDIVYLINFLFKEGPPPNPLILGDANCNGYLTMGDLVYLITYLYKGGPPPDC